MLTAKEIQQIVASGEGYNVDFKRMVPAKVRDLTEEVCSFANSAGGYVLIGVKDDGTIVGAEIDNSKRSAIQGSIGEVSPRLSYSLYPVTVGRVQVWVIDVPAGVAKPYLFGGAIFVRDGATCQKLTRIDDIRSIFQQNERVYYDATPMPSVNLLENLDRDTYAEFMREARLDAELPVEQVMENLQVMERVGVPRTGGVLFFHKAPEQYVFHAVTRCLLFKGTDKMFIMDDKTFGGTLVHQYNSAISWLKSKLQVSYVIEGTGPRREVWEIPMTVFKEAIINALAHRDYYEQGASVTIEVYDDRVEITNPGGLLPLVALNFGKRSLSRNPLIFGLFTRMHLVEHVGSGIPRMRKEMLDNNLREPQFDKEGMFAVTLYRRGSQPAEADERELQILNIISRDPRCSISQMQQELGLSRSTVNKLLKRLRETGRIRRVGRRNDGWWSVG